MEFAQESTTRNQSEIYAKNKLYNRQTQEIPWLVQNPLHVAAVQGKNE